MTSSFPRGALTTYLIGQLSSQVLIGDGEAPEAGGWDDDPNAPESSYSPYVVLAPQTAQEASGSFDDSNSEWRIPYTLSSYGITREQVEWNADRSRQAMVSLARVVVDLDTGNWKIQQSRVNSIGGVARNDNTEPSEFSQVDVVTMWMSKEMS